MGTQELPCGIRAEELSPFRVGWWSPRGLRGFPGLWWLIFQMFFLFFFSNICLSKYNKGQICCWLFHKTAYLPAQHSPFCSLLSMNGHSVVPQSVVHFYSATKYAVTALTEGLRQELREAKTHIRATVSTGRVLPLCWLCGWQRAGKFCGAEIWGSLFVCLFLFGFSFTEGELQILLGCALLFSSVYLQDW